jgi:hypothetical protein
MTRSFGHYVDKGSCRGRTAVGRMLHWGRQQCAACSRNSPAWHSTRQSAAAAGRQSSRYQACARPRDTGCTKASSHQEASAGHEGSTAELATSGSSTQQHKIDDQQPRCPQIPPRCARRRWHSPPPSPGPPPGPQRPREPRPAPAAAPPPGPTTLAGPRRMPPPPARRPPAPAGAPPAAALRPRGPPRPAPPGPRPRPRCRPAAAAAAAAGRALPAAPCRPASRRTCSAATGIKEWSAGGPRGVASGQQGASGRQDTAKRAGLRPTFPSAP